MDHYLKHLIQDFNLTEVNPTPNPAFGNTYDEFEKQMLEIEEARPEPVKQIIGIGYERIAACRKNDRRANTTAIGSSTKYIIGKRDRYNFSRKCRASKIGLRAIAQAV